MTMLISIQETPRLASDDSPLGARCLPRSVGRRRVLVFGFNDRDLLSSIVPISDCQSEKRAIARHARSGESDRLPALQALQSGRTLS